jgi:hypothetical protein
MGYAGEVALRLPAMGIQVRGGNTESSGMAVHALSALSLAGHRRSDKAHIDDKMRPNARFKCVD